MSVFFAVCYYVMLSSFSCGSETVTRMAEFIGTEILLQGVAFSKLVCLSSVIQLCLLFPVGVLLDSRNDLRSNTLSCPSMYSIVSPDCWVFAQLPRPRVGIRYNPRTQLWQVRDLHSCYTRTTACEIVVRKAAWTLGSCRSLLWPSSA